MSGWDAYVKALIGDASLITGAAIYGRPAGNNHSTAPGLWATSGATFISAEEIFALSGALHNAEKFNSMSGTGFKIGGVKFMKINSEEEKIIRGKAGEYASAAAVSKKAIVVAVGKGSPQDISNKVEKMAADLASKQF